jgi:mannose/cellobiose epimerase-like protein (N-acyl-D-glucosamine 2-epimerase family)/anti-anti-sigma regulatory factor
MTDKMHFTFSDMVAGYVTRFEWEKDNVFDIESSDGRAFTIQIGDNCFAELIRNLGEAFIDCTGSMKNMLAKGRYLFAYGIFYPEGGEVNFEAKHLVFSGRFETDHVFEQQNWWIKQIRQLADFYLNAQFPDGVIDYSEYRTHLTAGGHHENDMRQETDTISRLVYGFASAYLLTGEPRYLEAADKGTKYLRDHFRCENSSDDTCYWYHAIDLKGAHEKKILASEFGDDYDAIPAYEQIYALAGPTQTYRITGEPAIASDIQKTINMFQKYYLDRKLGGYFSHVDPVTFDPRSETLDKNRARKNWNSVGDHAPAFLINAVLATGNREWADMLEYCADMITEHFQDYENSPFVNEKFHEDWSHDQTWGWQQNRAVVGHNLKIAWNLTRIQSMVDKKEYEEFARKIADLMPKHGMDIQRGGWYDVVSRVVEEGQEWHRYAWHDRKAWWQQEQGILAYQILAGVHKEEKYLKLARESTAFYNAWFLDHDAGGVYFNVLANGLPYMVGNEREKGSHSMSGYHSFELCYLAAVYTNLLITKQAMDLFFQPLPASFPGRVLRVAPDMLPKGSIRIEAVAIDGKPYEKFDADELTVQLPESELPLEVRVTIVPTSGLDHFSCSAEGANGSVTLTPKGDLDARAVPHFSEQLASAYSAQRLVIDMTELSSICPEGARALLFARQKMAVDEPVYIVGAAGEVAETLAGDEFMEEVTCVAKLSDLPANG